MSPDPFPSSPPSVLLAWIVALPAILGFVVGGIGMLFEKTDDQIPRWFVVWITLCVLVLSPLRYMMLQIIVASAYMVQSVGAFFSILPLAMYVPIVASVLYFVGLGVPLLLTLYIPFGNLRTPRVTTGRLLLGALAAPINAIGGYLAFFWVLQFAAVSVHWLRAEDVIGATNGPAFVTYDLALKHFMPLPMKEFYGDVTQSDREMLRNHVASYYLGNRAEARYVHLAYPDLFKRLTTGLERGR